MEFIKKIIILIVICLFFGTILSTNTITSKSILYDQSDQEQTHNSGSYWIYQCNYMAQEFKPTLNVLSKIYLLFSKEGSPPNDLFVSIRSELYGPDLISKTISPNNIPTIENWMEIDFQDIKVTPEESYYIVCKTIDGNYNPLNLYGWCCHESNPYSRGDMFRSLDCGSNWIEGDSYNSDFCFITYGYNEGNPPTISIISPEPGFITGTVDFEAVANSEIGINRVCFYVDGQKISEDENRPYETQLISTNYNDGIHTLKVQAFDLIGQSSEDHVDFIFDNHKPDVSITYPVDGSDVFGLVYIQVNAYDYGSGVEKIDFYIDNIFMQSDWSSPYSYQWNSDDFSSGSHMIKVVCHDSAGFNDNDIIFVTVNKDNEPPDNPIVYYEPMNDELQIYSTDQDQDMVRYGVSWRNDYNIDYWTNYHNSGEEITINCNGHQGYIGVIAEDIYGARSDWITHQISYNDLTVNITQPSPGIYILGNKLANNDHIIILGAFTIKVKVENYYDLQKVQYFLDGEIISESVSPPFTCYCALKHMGSGTLKVIAIDKHNTAEDIIDIEYYKIL